MHGRMTVQQIREVAERIRQARRNPQRLTYERALKLFEEHRQAAARSRLGWKPSRPLTACAGEGQGIAKL